MKVTEIGKILFDALDKIISGHTELKKFLPIAILSEEHIYIEGPPGTAKTLSSELEADMLELSFYHLQASTETRMADIIGPHFLKREKYISPGIEKESLYDSFEPGAFLTHELGFIDEGPSLPKDILKSILGILHERRYPYFDVETKENKWYSAKLRTLIFAGNPKEKSSKSLDKAFLDRFSLGIYCRNLLFKKKIKELRDAMYRSRTWPENLISLVREIKIDKAALNEAYEYIGGEKRMPIPYLMTWALLTLIETIVEVENFTEDDALITDRALINKMYKLMRAHAVFEGRLHVTWDDFRFIYGYITLRVPKEHLKRINKTVELFIDVMKNHKHTEHFFKIAKKADDIRYTLDADIVMEPEKTEREKEYQEYERELEDFFNHIKLLFVTAREKILTMDSHKDILNAISNEPFEDHFREKKEDRNADSITERSSRETAQKEHDEQKMKQTAKSGAPDKTAGIEIMIEAFIDPDAGDTELSTSQSNEAGPESEIVIRGLKNFEEAVAPWIYFDEIEPIISEFETQIEKEAKRGRKAFKREIRAVDEIMIADPAHIGQFLDTGAPRPQKTIYTIPFVDIGILRDVSYSMAGQKDEKTLLIMGNSARWASQISLAICHEAKERGAGYFYLDFSEEKFFSEKQTDSLNEQMRMRQLDIHRIHQIKDTDCAGATDFEFGIEKALRVIKERESRYGEALTILTVITDGKETVSHGKLNALLKECGEKMTVICPIFIFDPLAGSASSYFVYKIINKKPMIVDITAPPIIKKISEETNGMYFFGLYDPFINKIALAAPAMAVKIVRALSKEREIKSPDFTSGAKDYKAFAKNFSIESKPQEKPFDTSELFKDKRGAR